MSERRVLVKTHARGYQRAGKKEKGRIMEVFVQATGYNRVYAARLLRSHGRRIHLGGRTVVRVDAVSCVKRQRARIYGPVETELLKRLWEYLDYPCGKRLVEALPGALESLSRHGEIEESPQTSTKLLRMSSSTADRLLAAERRKETFLHRGGTKPGTLLKSQIEIRTFADWDEDRPGFVEIDLVAHEGGNSAGDFIQTLDVTDVHTGWSEQVAVLNKAQVWVLQALKQVRGRLPFPLLGVDSDNGGEFINADLLKYCRGERITFTRSRPSRKNDNCFVEQKNYSIVRRTVGYGRYVGTKALEELNHLYEWLRLRTNFFLPSMKLIEKHRHGSRVSKRYDKPKAPYQRVLESAHVCEEHKESLRYQFQSLNLAQLDREIRQSQARLLRMACRTGQETGHLESRSAIQQREKLKRAGLPG
jgi:hypothetical protein